MIKIKRLYPFIIFSLFTLANSETNSGPIVTLSYPKGLAIIGTTSLTRNGNTINEFLGIPYAIAKRFETSVPFESNTNRVIVNATQFGPKCIQYTFSSKILGSQNCLYLNVFTKNIEKKNASPVLVFVHSGGFFMGSSDPYKGTYLLDEDIVLVTFNYQLGPWGFLQAKGVANNGLKDQVLALKWIQRNIKNFGGDPDKVTLWGESAGGASVSYHLISPLSKGLFHRAISSSGVLTSGWAFTKNPEKSLSKIRELTNCTQANNTIYCLQRKDPKDILKFYELMSIGDDSSPFAPSIEPDNKGAFLLGDPEDLLNSPKAHINKVPWMNGVTSAEGVMSESEKVLSNPIGLTIVKSQLNNLAKMFLFLKDDNVIDQVKDFYFGKELNVTRAKIRSVISDRHFYFPAIRAADIFLKRLPAVYLYYFNYTGIAPQTEAKMDGGFDLTMLKNLRLNVPHADDLNYFFPIGASIDKTSEHYEFSKNLIKLWVSFMVNGKPTHTWGDVKIWPKIEKSNPKIWFNIDKNTRLLEDPPFNSRMDFWRSLNLKY